MAASPSEPVTSPHTTYHCVPPPNVENSRYLASDTYPAGFEAEYQCIEGYVHKGIYNTKLICAALGHNITRWVGNEIVCKLKGKNGKVSVQCAKCL